MKVAISFFLSLLLSSSIVAQTSKDIFELKGQLGLTDKDDTILQTASLEKGNEFLLVGKNQLQVWDVATAKLIRSSPHKITAFWEPNFFFRRLLPGKVNIPLLLNVDQMQLSPDGTIGITVSRPSEKDRLGAILVWNLRNGDSLGRLTRPIGPVREAQFSENGSTLMTIHGDVKNAELVFWDVESLSQRNSIPVADISFQQLSRDGEHVYIAAGKANKWLDVTVMSYDPSNAIEVWNTRTGKREASFTDGSAKFRSTVFVSSDNKYVVARSTDEKIDVWETSGDGSPKYRIEQPASRLNYGLLGISKDSKYLLTSTKNEARVYDLATGNLYRTFPMREEALPYSYTLSPDSRLAVISGDAWIANYDLEKEKYVFTYTIRTESQQLDYDPNSREHEVEKPRMSPDGKFMMIDGRKDIRVYEMATGELVQSLIDPRRVKYKGNGEVKDSGLNHSVAGWLSSGNSIYAVGADGRSFYLWNKK
ncbi:MAG: hypothetical protein DMF63_01690 [Acidobacteria bacterium]|nr:MAG: hypothetical protein DMF63_01690 [Acidobacteriota bacterium]